MAVVNELAMIPFGTLIGGPLNAAVEAQAKAAMTTVDFIRAVGFKPVEDGKPLEPASIVFKYKNGPDPSDMIELEVPLLTIVPIPFLRIENMDIHFKASLSQSMETKDTQSSSTAGEAKVSGSAKYMFFKAEMSASISSKKDSSSTRDSRYAVEYTMDINVHAVQDDMPAGMAKVLNLLNEAMDRSLQARPSSNGHKQEEKEKEGQT
jgi:hypothetical protein